MIKRTILLFTGQGSQYGGMGLTLKENIISKKYWALANSVLKKNIRDVSFYGSNADIKKTNNCQMLLFVNEYISSRLILKNKLIKEPTILGGFSLGEVSAYICSGITNFINGLLVINQRCFLMGKCCDIHKGAMLAILNKKGLDAWGKAIILCKKLKLQLSNINSLNQIVVSGNCYSISVLKEFLSKPKVKLNLNYKVVLLKVSGAYHSSLMNQAGLNIFEFMNKFSLRPPQKYIFNNVTGDVFVKYNSKLLLVFNIAKQILKSVNLNKNIVELLKIGNLDFIEMNKLKTVTNIIKVATSSSSKNKFTLLDDVNIKKVLDLLQ